MPSLSSPNWINWMIIILFSWISCKICGNNDERHYQCFFLFLPSPIYDSFLFRIWYTLYISDLQESLSCLILKVHSILHFWWCYDYVICIRRSYNIIFCSIGLVLTGLSINCIGWSYSVLDVEWAWKWNEVSIKYMPSDWNSP